MNDAARENRLTRPIDGVLNLLDRQLLDSDGKMLGKVDDVELTEQDDTLVITALLTGHAALLDRLGGRLGAALVAKWAQLKVSEPDRSRPWRIDIDDVDRLDSAVHLAVPRDGVLRRDTEARRLGRLTRMKVLGPDNENLGRVLDARFERGLRDRLVLHSLIIGPGRPGSLLGYDRHRRQGPWLIRVLVDRLHRRTGIIGIDAAEILWDAAQVRLRRLPDPGPGHPFAD